jgi:hypothetical protein
MKSHYLRGKNHVAKLLLLDTILSKMNAYNLGKSKGGVNTGDSAQLNEQSGIYDTRSCVGPFSQGYPVGDAYLPQKQQEFEEMHVPDCP